VDRILISACLLGRPVRYDGRGKAISDPRLERWKTEGRLVPVCPEVLAGLPTPRPQAEIEPGHSGQDVLDGRGRVFEATGRDASDDFRRGAEAAGYLERRPRGGGGRVLVITPAGRAILSRIWPVYDTALHGAVSAHMTNAEVAALVEILGARMVAPAD